MNQPEVLQEITTKWEQHKAEADQALAATQYTEQGTPALGLRELMSRIKVAAYHQGVEEVWSQAVKTAEALVRHGVEDHEFIRYMSLEVQRVASQATMAKGAHTGSPEVDAEYAAGATRAALAVAQTYVY